MAFLLSLQDDIDELMGSRDSSTQVSPLPQGPNPATSANRMDRLNERNSEIRRNLKPLLSDPKVKDSIILDQVTRLATEEAERIKRLVVISKPKVATVNASQHPGAQGQQPILPKLTVEANQAAIHQLAAQVAALAQNVDKLMKSGQTESPWVNTAPPNTSQSSLVGNDQYPTTGARYFSPAHTLFVPQDITQHVSPRTLYRPPTNTRPQNIKGRCRVCIQQGKEQCRHCFCCGQVGHRAVGCRSWSESGNEVRSLGRDAQ
ncbi:hypothetical protein MHYP_G00217750 [Metynnis hypsauchen]